MVVARIERRNVMQIAAARGAKQLRVLHGYLFKRLQTVNGKTGADDIDTTKPLGAEFADRFIGIRSQPFGAADARLEGDQPLRVVELQCCSDKPGRL